MLKDSEGAGDTKGSAHNLCAEHQNNGNNSSLLKDKRIRGWFPRKCAVEVVSDDSYYDDCKMKSNKQSRLKDSSEDKLKSRSHGEGKKHQ